MNSSDRIAAQRYAQAYNDLSTSNDEAAQLCLALTQAAQALKTAQVYMTSPRVSLTAKQELVRTSLNDAPKTAAFLELLLAAKRYYLLDEIVTHVQALLDKRMNIVRATIVSARELTPVQKQETLQVLSARYGAKAEGVFQVDPSLLGGLRIDCCGELIDGSFKGRLQKLQEELTK